MRFSNSFLILKIRVTMARASLFAVTTPRVLMIYAFTKPRIQKHQEQTIHMTICAICETIPAMYMYIYILNQSNQTNPPEKQVSS